MALARTSDPTVARLRAELAGLDFALVLGLCARERVQHRLLSWKRTHAAPLVDRRQEERVRRRARAVARTMGGDPDLAADLVMAAIRSGLRRFARPGPRVQDAAETVTCFIDLGERWPVDPSPRKATTGPPARAGIPGVAAPPSDAWAAPGPVSTSVAVGRSGRAHGRAPAAGGP